jgi:beta-galactosidase
VEENVARDWMEYLILETAEPVAYYDHPYFKEYPAVTINNYGKGTLLYQGSLFSDQVQTEMLKRALQRASVESTDHRFTWPVIAKSGTNDFGNDVHFYYNYSSDPKEIGYLHPTGTELVTGEAVAEGETVEIGPWDLLIIEEN